MREWPPITEPELLARLALDDEGFLDFIATFVSAVGPRDYSAASLERALGYPWARPPGSYALRGGEVTTLDDMDAAKRSSVIADFTRERHPIVAIGANGAPQALIERFAHFEAQDDRDALVLTGTLHDMDVGVIPTVTLYGSMPAALFESPGTLVRVSVVWLTDAQATQLTWTELGYRLGRIEDARFEVDGAEAEVDCVFAFIARLGAYCPDDDGRPVALASVPATGRTARALTQEELLNLVASQLMGPDASAEELVRAVHDNPGAFVERARELLWPRGVKIPSSRVTLLPTP